MKIIEASDFLQCPPGTLYHEFQGGIFGELLVKEETINAHQFYYTNFNAQPETPNGEDGDVLLSQAAITHEVFPLEMAKFLESVQDARRLFAIYSKGELLMIIKFLQFSLDRP